MLNLNELLKHHKISITPDFAATKMQREGSQWLRAYDYSSTKIVYFGDYKTGVSEKWESDSTHLTEAELKAHKAHVKRAEAARREEVREEQIRVKLKVEAEWPTFIDRGTTEYLKRKKIDQLYGCCCRNFSL